jgi:stage II sporulation protein M
MSYKWWIIIAVSLFSVGIILGLSTPTSFANLPAEDINDLVELADFLATIPNWAVFIIILFKNISALVISFIFSPFLCLVPVIALVLNGWLIGFVSTSVLQEESLGYLLGGLLPHGIFEIPALLIGEAVALSFGTALIVALFNRERRTQLLPHFRQNLKYLGVALALLLPAAIIEAFITPLVLNRVV